MRRPAWLPPLAGGTLPDPSSSDTYEVRGEVLRIAQEPLRVMLLIQVKWRRSGSHDPDRGLDRGLDLAASMA